MAKRFGLQGAHERCHTCSEKDRCGFFLDLAASPCFKCFTSIKDTTTVTSAIAASSGLISNIEDTMNVFVRYDTGAHAELLAQCL